MINKLEDKKKKVLNRDIHINKYPMKKRGQLETTAVVIGVVLLISSLVAGGIYSEKIISVNRYVGDKESNLVYDMSNCDVSHILKENKVPFSSLDASLKEGYYEASCNKK